MIKNNAAKVLIQLSHCCVLQNRADTYRRCKLFTRMPAFPLLQTPHRNSVLNVPCLSIQTDILYHRYTEPQIFTEHHLHDNKRRTMEREGLRRRVRKGRGDSPHGGRQPRRIGAPPSARDKASPDICSYKLIC